MVSIISKIKKFYNKHSEKEGASLVTVIIGITFLATLGIVLLMVSTNYLSAVHVDKYSTDNFYQTDGILSEIKTGLIEYSGDSAEEAYNEVMQKYTTYTASCKDEFSRKYLNLMVKKIAGIGATWNTWADAKVGIEQKTSNIAGLKSLSINDSNAVSTKNGSNLSYIIAHDEKKGYELILKDLVIDHTDSADYNSKVQTDVVLSVPDYKFEGDSTIDALKEYISVSDEKLDVEGSLVKRTQFLGSVYSGKEINISQQNQVSFLSQNIISRDDLTVWNGLDGSGTNVSITGEPDVNGKNTLGNLWVKNIKVVTKDDDSTSPVTLSLNDNIYVENDLDIQANAANVSLKGNYYGYSYNEDNDGNIGATDAKYSSAILVNGLDTTLNADSGLTRLILAGRSFVSRNDDTKKKVTSDIQMGESIAVKSNQLAYLVPSDFLATNDSLTDGHNPMTEEEYKKFNLANLKTKLLTASDENDFYKYLDTTMPYETNFSNVGGYVFFYLKFKNDQAANEYFKHYYTKDSAGERDINRKAKPYIAANGGDLTGLKISPTLFLVAGNIIDNYSSTDGSAIQSANYYDGSSADNVLLEDGKRIGREYVGRQLTLLPENPTGSMRLDADSAPNLVAGSSTSVLIKSALPGSEKKYPTPVAGTQIVATSGDYTIDSADSGMIIAGGDVEVEDDYTGLILAGGEVNVSKGVNLKADIVQTSKLFEYIQSDEELSSYFTAFSKDKSANSSELEKCISCQNWLRDE